MQGVVGRWGSVRASDENAAKLDYFWFDFHAECKNMHYENIAKLVEMTETPVKQGEWALHGSCK